MSTFKNYTIIRSIGKGGMSEVFLALDNRFKTKVAIKVLNRDFSSNSNISQRFIAEARNLFRMSHPNIVRVTDLIEEDGKKAFVMEYIEGKNLRDEVEKLKTLNSEVIGAFLSQMLSALGYCHSEGLVHRDIKPSNFMITSKGQIKLLDFGIAKQTEYQSEYTKTGTSQMIGTPLYMSPEQILETKSVDLRSDIYSLGVVLWQLVTGKNPYDSQTLSAFQIQLKIVKDPLSVTGSKFDGIIQKCTAKDPKDRFQNCEEVKRALSELYKNLEIIYFNEDTIHDFKTYKTNSLKLNKAQNRSFIFVNIWSSLISKIKLKINKFYLIFLIASLVSILLVISFNYSLKSSQPNAVDSDEFYKLFSSEMILVHGGKYSRKRTLDKDISSSNNLPNAHKELEVKIENSKDKYFTDLLVQVSSFYISKFEITQKQWKAVMGNNPSANNSCDECPVENVSWDEVQEFIKKLNSITGKSFRLPTEAEWQFAAIGGNYSSDYSFSGSNSMVDVAWCEKNSQWHSHPVGMKRPNELGIFDMSGNVSEWCLDYFSPYSTQFETDPINKDYSTNRAVRGCSYSRSFLNGDLRSRFGINQSGRSSSIGFRLVLPMNNTN